MRRVLFFLLLCSAVSSVGAAAAEPFTRGLLWEISRPGSATSYLFGTMHSADPRLLNLDPRVEQAFADSRAYVLEMYPDAAVAERFDEAAELPAGRRLS
ncbi:MAG TPA: TraB/GumN family protein, partial [Rhodocyclaceae bacterium]|nr:TraB/GumN family protein [Rhodocyclaceae bacterium]